MSGFEIEWRGVRRTWRLGVVIALCAGLAACATQPVGSIAGAPPPGAGVGGAPAEPNDGAFDDSATSVDELTAEGAEAAVGAPSPSAAPRLDRRILRSRRNSFDARTGPDAAPTARPLEYLAVMRQRDAARRVTPEGLDSLDELGAPPAEEGWNAELVGQATALSRRSPFEIFAWIGKSAADDPNILVDPAVSPAVAEALAASEFVEVEIVAHCPFCDPEEGEPTTQSQTVIYRRGAELSAIGAFRFRPARGEADPDVDYAFVTLSFAVDGAIVDVREAPVVLFSDFRDLRDFAASDPARERLARTAAAERSGAAVITPAANTRPPRVDATIYLHGQAGGPQTVSFRVRRRDCIGADASALLDSFGRSPTFDTNLDDAAEAQLSIYLDLTELVTRRFSRSGDVASLGPDWERRGVSQRILDPVLRADAEEEMRRVGRTLRRLVFPSGGPADLMARGLERCARVAAGEGRPYRIEVASDNVLLPWQLMHPEESASDAGDAAFWGLTMRLGVRLAARAPAAPSALRLSEPDDALYLGYFGADDLVAGRADGFGETIAEILADGAGYQGLGAPKHDNLDQMIGDLQSRADELELLISYGHANTAALIEPGAAPGDVERLLVSAVGKRLVFNDNPDLRLTPAALFSRWSRRCGAQGRCFDRQPLVMLIGCETGVQADRQINGDFVRLMVKHFGARGVLSTEAEVPVDLSRLLITDMLDEMTQGAGLSDALLVQRQKWWKRGWLGVLLFSYVGDPDVTVAGGA